MSHYLPPRQCKGGVINYTNSNAPPSEHASQLNSNLVPTLKMGIHSCTHIHTHTHTHMCAHTHAHTYIHTHVRTLTYTYTYTRTHVHMHTYIQTHTYNDLTVISN